MIGPRYITKDKTELFFKKLEYDKHIGRINEIKKRSNQFSCLNNSAIDGQILSQRQSPRKKAKKEEIKQENHIILEKIIDINNKKKLKGTEQVVINQSQYSLKTGHNLRVRMQELQKIIEENKIIVNKIIAQNPSLPNQKQMKEEISFYLKQRRKITKLDYFAQPKHQPLMSSTANNSPKSKLPNIKNDTQGVSEDKLQQKAKMNSKAQIKNKLGINNINDKISNRQELQSKSIDLGKQQKDLTNVKKSYQSKKNDGIISSHSTSIPNKLPLSQQNNIEIKNIQWIKQDNFKSEDQTIVLKQYQNLQNDEKQNFNETNTHQDKIN